MSEFDTLVEALREDESSIISPAKFANAFHMQLQDLAADASVHRNTLRVRPDAPKMQRFLRDALKVLSATTEIQGDIGRCMYWMRNRPIPAFAHKTAWELASDGRVEDVIAYIGSLSAGYAG